MAEITDPQVVRLIRVLRVFRLGAGEDAELLKSYLAWHIHGSGKWSSNISGWSWRRRWRWGWIYIYICICIWIWILIWWWWWGWGWGGGRRWRRCCYLLHTVEGGIPCLFWTHGETVFSRYLQLTKINCHTARRPVCCWATNYVEGWSGFHLEGSR